MKKEQPVKVSKYDKIWLQELYKVIQENKRPSYRVLRAELYKSLPADYNPDNIDKRLAQFNGEEILLQGVDFIDPKLNVISKANKVIDAIRTIIIQSPEKDEVTLNEIAFVVDIDKREISLILRLISPFGKFWNSASGNQEFQFGYGSLRIQNDNQIFNQYLYFTDIRDLQKQYYAESKLKKRFYENPLTTAPQQDQSNEIRLKPIFKSKISSVDKNICFVLMPFKESWSDEIFKLIKSSVESLGFQCLRADDLNGQIIIEDIWIKINQAGFIIADVTGRNPNVMYEVGIAHTVGRPTLLLTQNTKEIPFDFTHLRHIDYKTTFSGPKELKRKLKEAIENIYKTDEQLSKPNSLKSISGIFGKKMKKGL